MANQQDHYDDAEEAYFLALREKGELDEFKQPTEDLCTETEAFVYLRDGNKVLLAIYDKQNKSVHFAAAE